MIFERPRSNLVSSAMHQQTAPRPPAAANPPPADSFAPPPPTPPPTAPAGGPYLRRKKLVDKPFQVKFAVDVGLFVFVLLLMVGGLTYLSDTTFSSRLIGQYVATDSSSDLYAKLDEHAKFSFMMIFVFTALAAGMLGFIAIYLTHRVVGPLVRFKHSINTLIEGTIPGPIVLRQNDAGKEMALKLNQFFAALRMQTKHDLSMLNQIQENAAHLGAEADPHSTREIMRISTLIIEQKKKLIGSESH